VMHYLWDPIGISGAPEARDEYHSYVPPVFSLLINGGSVQDIANFLDTTATEKMGFSDVQGGGEHSQKIATILKRWHDFLHHRDESGASPN